MRTSKLGRGSWRVALAAGLLGWCGSGVSHAQPTPAAQTAAADCAPPSSVERLPDGRERMTLDVMTYNIEGLGWPARRHRDAQLAQIGDRLAALNAQGRAPDVVLFQEVFSDAAKSAVEASGYTGLVHGPGRRSRSDLPEDRSVLKGFRHRSFKRGEIGMKLVSGGLAIASRYPITVHKAEPFGRRSCAGFDCLSNKGALFARVSVPGAPEPIDIFDTHMNARHASGAPRKETLAIHHAESEELADFIASYRVPTHPALLGGDFNVRHSAPRFGYLEPLLPMTLAERSCRAAATGCDFELASADATPWLDSEDLQFFASGGEVAVRPIRISTLFDGKPGSPRLSDHVGLRVVYELTWAPDALGAGACRRAG